MKHKHHTHVIVTGCGCISVRHWDMFTELGFPLHLCRGPRWWGEALRKIPKV